MRKRMFSFVFILFLSCKSSVPKDVLPPKKMQAVLWDVMRADMMVNTLSARDTSLDKFAKNTELYQQIFRIHGITKEQFKRSINYYRTHPVLMQTTFDSLYAQASRTVDTTAIK